MTTKSSAGGAAAAGGMDFQHRVAAWVAVHILAEKDVNPPWNLPADTTLEWLRCENEQPVDDLLVGASNDGFVFAQIKRRLSLSKGVTSDLASALDQFVHQVIACRRKTTAMQHMDRPLDPEKDRLVLITSSDSSESIRVHFSEVLNRVRHLLPNHPVDEAARNEKDRQVLLVVKTHLTRSWQNVSKAVPSDDEVREILSFIRVHVLDPNEGGTNEGEAKNLIRSTIIRDPIKADLAWAQLVNLCAGFALHRSGTDRKNLQRELLNAGIELQSARSYRGDIEGLKAHSRLIFESLAYLSRIRVGSVEVKIQRPCTEALRRAAEVKSILVVGEPGAGKSGALHALVDTLTEEGRDSVFLAVDRLAARSLGDLRSEIGLIHELSEVLDNWPGLQPSFLVIDALDAARWDPTGRMIRDLIRRVVEKNGRWHVVASIRKFDLRYSDEIKQLFKGEPSLEFRDAEFSNVRHLNIPCLSEKEIGQISVQSPELFAFLARTPPELHDLLRIPFNLQLVTEMFDAGDTSNELLPIRTQLGLLDLYWLRRVIHFNDGLWDAREAVLRDVCEKMVAERALRIHRSVVARPKTSILLQDLLSMQVLIEWQPSPEMPPEQYILAFAHHVLFDYAVARLLLRGDPEMAVHRILDDPDLVVVIRPSLLLHFRHLWTIGVPPFWYLIFRINREARIPEIGKLIGPLVAAELARTQSDLEPLVLALKNPSAETKSAAEQALRHLVGALLAAATSEARLVGNDDPWCEFLENMSRDLRPSLACTVLSLLTAICDQPEGLTPEQLAAAGQTARRLLEFAWSLTPRDRGLVIQALRCVCRTFASNPPSSSALIRRSLEPFHLSHFGFEEMPRVAEEVKGLISLDPGLVEEIYHAAFGHHETSNETTSIGSSRILPLSSNRRQDYEMTLYELAKVFPQFLEGAPDRATRALIAVMKAYVAQNHPLASGEEDEKIFDFNGIQARFCTDYSAIWDDDVYRNDEPIQMLDTFQRYIEELAKKQDRIEQLRMLVQIIISENRLAVLWGRLLISGSRFPSTIGREILPLSWTVPILIGYDTTIKVGEFLSAIFPILDHEERERIERAILMIPETLSKDYLDLGESIRNRLLGCLANERIATAEARHMLEVLRGKNAIPTNEPLVSSHAIMGGPYSEEEYLEDRGVPVEAEANQEIRELERPVKEFEDKHRKSDPTLEDLNEIFAALQELHNALSRADKDRIHPMQRDYAWGHLVAACALIARTHHHVKTSQSDALARSVLLEASFYPEPTYRPENDAQFDEHISWGLPAARIEAAIGLTMLASHPSCVCPDVLEAIERLSKDPVPAVRFQVAAHATALYQTAREMMWQIIERSCHEEPSRGVLQGLLGGALGSLSGIEPDRVADLTKSIYYRVREGSGASKVRGSCVNIFSGLFIWRSNALCGEIVREIASNPADNFDEAHHVLMNLRKPLKHGSMNLSDLETETIRHRAFDLLASLLQSSREGLRQLEGGYKGVQFNEWSQQDQEKAKSLVRLMDRVGSEVYFASGAYDSKRLKQIVATFELEPESARFYWEASTIFDMLADAGIPSVAHHLLETLEFFVTLEPREVFLRIGLVVYKGQQGGYQYESLAANLVVKLVERYLAEYRSLFKDDVDCRRTLIDILDVFVQAGWPNARRLTYGLGDIFR